MATISKKVCDRCGKEIKYIGWTGRFKKIPKKIHLIKYLNGNHDGYSYSEFEIEVCTECVESFNKWYKEVQNDR